MSPESSRLLVDKIVPMLERLVPRAVRCVGSEDTAEVVQDGVATAAKLLDSAEKNGRDVTPSNVVYYAVQRLRSGRRSTSSSRTCVLAPATRLDGSAIAVSMDATVGTAEMDDEAAPDLHSLLTSSREDPATEACRRIDWDELLPDVGPLQRAIIDTLVEGRTLTKVALEHWVSSAWITMKKKALGQQIHEAWGDDVLDDVRQAPQWRRHVEAFAEQRRCRATRASI